MSDLKPGDLEELAEEKTRAAENRKRTGPISMSSALQRVMAGELVGAEELPGDPEPAPVERPRDRRAELVAMGAPLRAIDTLAHFRTNALTERARRWLTQDPGALVLAAGKGTGKSTAMTWLLSQEPTEPFSARREDWPASLRGLFIPAFELATLSRWRDREELRRLREVWLLAVDDLGLEPLGDSGHALGLIQYVLNTRHDDNRRTVMTCNLTPTEFRDRYGDRIWDRLHEGGGDFFTTKATSMRRQ